MSRRRGFSLMEMLLVVVLAGGLLVLALTMPRGARERGETMAAAEQLAAELRSARQAAISQGGPVAVCLPSAGGSQPHTRSLYLLSGESHPRVSRVLTQSGNCYLAVGAWPLGGGLSYSSAPPSMLRGSNFSLTAGPWTHPYPEDPTIVFLPSGTVHSNLPHAGGSYRLLVCSGLTYAAATVAGRPGFTLDNLYHPVTVCVTLSGQVWVQPGVKDGAGVTVHQGHLAPAVPPAPPPALAPLVNHDPEIVGAVELAPEPVAATLPPGVDGTVRLGSYLTFRVQARDVDGDSLYCNWTCQESPGGAFSSGSFTRMTWDPSAGAWVSVWEWSPPAEATAGLQYHLSCEVSDLQGGAVTTLVGQTGTIQTLERELIFIASSERLGGGIYDLYALNTDGSGKQRLVDAPGTKDRGPDLSPDGTKVAFTRDRNLWIMNRDGSGQRLVATPVRGCEFVRWNPQGTKLVYADSDHTVSTTWNLCLVNPDGSHPNTLLPNMPKVLGSFVMTNHVAWACWSPSGDRILLCDNGDQLTEVGIDQSTWSVAWQGAVFTPPPITYPKIIAEYSPDGNWVAYKTDRLYVAPYTSAVGGPGTLGAPVLVGGAFNSACEPRWSPDSQHVIFNYDPNGGPRGTADYVSGKVERGGANLVQLTPYLGAGREWVSPAWVRR